MEETKETEFPKKRPMNQISTKSQGKELGDWENLPLHRGYLSILL